jgi:hypothetical protein
VALVPVLIYILLYIFLAVVYAVAEFTYKKMGHDFLYESQNNKISDESLLDTVSWTRVGSQVRLRDFSKPITFLNRHNGLVPK